MDEPPLIIRHEETDSECRSCEQHREIIDNLTSGYTPPPTLAKNEHRTGTHVHYSTCRALGIEKTENGVGARARTHTHTHKAIM